MTKQYNKAEVLKTINDHYGHNYNDVKITVDKIEQNAVVQFTVDEIILAVARLKFSDSLVTSGDDFFIGIKFGDMKMGLKPAAPKATHPHEKRVEEIQDNV